MAGKTQYIEYTYKSNAKWILSLTPVAVTGVHPAGSGERGGKKNGVNYCFKSSCEINETLRALCWLKRSLPTFNRLFNHTEPDLCVRSFVFCFFFFSPKAVARLLHAKSFEASRDVFTNNNRMSLSWMQSEAPARQTVPTKRPELLLGEEKKKTTTTYGRLLSIFFVSSRSLSVADYAAQVLSARSVLKEVSAERKQDFTLTVTLSLYWSWRIYIFQLFLFFLPRILWVGWHWR